MRQYKKCRLQNIFKKIIRIHSRYGLCDISLDVYKVICSRILLGHYQAFTMSTIDHEDNPGLKLLDDKISIFNR